MFCAAPKASVMSSTIWNTLVSPLTRLTQWFASPNMKALSTATQRTRTSTNPPTMVFSRSTVTIGVRETPNPSMTNATHHAQAFLTVSAIQTVPTAYGANRDIMRGMATKITSPLATITILTANLLWTRFIVKPTQNIYWHLLVRIYITCVYEFAAYSSHYSITFSYSVAFFSVYKVKSV